MKKTLLFLAVLLLTGCALQAFNGTWTGNLISTKENTEETSCGSAELSLTISDGKVEGVATVGYGYELIVKGAVTSDDQIDAELWGDDDAEATLVGKIDGDSAGGTWNDRMGCFGTFALSRN